MQFLKRIKSMCVEPLVQYIEDYLVGGLAGYIGP